MLCEHYGGKWPFWLSPRQVMVVPVAQGAFEYAQVVHDKLHDAGIYVDVDLSNNQFPKKVALAQTNQFNFIVIVGEKEASERSVTIRLRGAEEQQQRNNQEQLPLDDFINRLLEMKSKHEA